MANHARKSGREHPHRREHKATGVNGCRRQEQASPYNIVEAGLAPAFRCPRIRLQFALVGLNFVRILDTDRWFVRILDTDQ